uniref:TNFAIP3 interacting protein 1 n=1 Tax=Ornithorhynchus anatinus TaxID=9258 RepID=A0A6I8PKD1_ORNAN
MGLPGASRSGAGGEGPKWHGPSAEKPAGGSPVNVREIFSWGEHYGESQVKSRLLSASLGATQGGWPLSTSVCLSEQLMTEATSSLKLEAVEREKLPGSAPQRGEDESVRALVTHKDRPGHEEEEKHLLKLSSLLPSASRDWLRPPSPACHFTSRPAFWFSRSSPVLSVRAMESAGSLLAPGNPPQHDNPGFSTPLERRFLSPDFTSCQPQISSTLASPHAPPGPTTEERTDSEEVVTYISESMVVTSADEEKLLLLNKNTELRRLNKELVKLNQEWDHIYRTTTLEMQQKLGSLQAEVVSLKQKTERLTMKLEHEQNKREYYEQTLVQELKKNQHLQEYVRHLESKMHPSGSAKPPLALGVPFSVTWEDSGDSPFPLGRKSLKDNPGRKYEAAGQKGRNGELPKTYRQKLLSSPSRAPPDDSDPRREVTDLKDQLEVLKCQTEIYEADYLTEHKDRERIKAENVKLRKKEEEMRQQMMLLQEQVCPLPAFPPKGESGPFLSSTRSPSGTYPHVGRGSKAAALLSSFTLRFSPATLLPESWVGQRGLMARARA